MVERREERILILAPDSEAELALRTLSAADLEGVRCGDVESLCGQIEVGAGVVVLGEGIVDEEVIATIADVLHRQPTWSDLPVIVLAASADAPNSMLSLVLDAIENLILLCRPTSPMHLIAAVRSSLRARRRQYQNRWNLAARQSQDAALRASERRFRSIFDQAAAGIALCAPDGRFLQVNQAFCSMLGYSEGDLLARNFRDISLPEDLVEEERFIARGLAGEIDSYSVEKRFRRRDNTIIWVDITCSEVRDSADNVEYAVAVAIDITEWKKAEAALRKSEERLRLAAEAAGIGIWEWEIPSDRQVWDERCKALFGLPPEAEVSYRVWLDALHPQERRALQVGTAKILAGRKEFNKEYRVVWPDGSIHWLLAQGRAHFEGRQAQRVSGIVLDITPMKQVEEVLQQAKEAADAANRAKSEFLTNMSHEIRTPLTVTMGAIELMKATAMTAEQSSYLEMARASSESLLRLIEELLDLSRIEAGRMVFHVTPFDVRTCLESTVHGFAPEAQRKGIRLSLEVEPEVPGIVMGDPDRLRQVLVNLVGNAIKFTERGEVAVTVRQEKTEIDARGNLLFFVRDTGIGIPREKMNRLFKPFSQVDSSHTRRFGGTGLGLALSKKLVERMGGAIWLESEAGSGSIFSFRLPLPPATVAAAPVSEEPVAPPPRSARILVAEDDPMIREMVEMFLRRRNWEVAAAIDGREAIAAWESGGFDLILMDVQMPEIDGLEAARRIRKEEQRRGGHIPIIAITAHARDVDKDECLAAGMDGYLSKPLKMKTLYAMVEEGLAKKD